MRDTVFLQRMHPNTTFYCTFCGSSHREVRKMIAAKNETYICEECVELCNQVLDGVGPAFFYERRFYCFSNFSSFAVEWRGRLWMTAEHAYQAAKFTDEDIIQKIFEARSAHDAKRVAHQHIHQVREDWDDIKLEVMEEICRAKLAQHAFVEKRLREACHLDYLDIIENSEMDPFWGWGPDRKGLNHLGKIWMKLGAELPPEK